jgi:hypothetical protein
MSRHNTLLCFREQTLKNSLYLKTIFVNIYHKAHNRGDIEREEVYFILSTKSKIKCPSVLFRKLKILLKKIFRLSLSLKPFEIHVKRTKMCNISQRFCLKNGRSAVASYLATHLDIFSKTSQMDPLPKRWAMKQLW